MTCSNKRLLKPNQRMIQFITSLDRQYRVTSEWTEGDLLPILSHANNFCGSHLGLFDPLGHINGPAFRNNSKVRPPMPFASFIHELEIVVS